MLRVCATVNSSAWSGHSQSCTPSPVAPRSSAAPSSSSSFFSPGVGMSQDMEMCVLVLKDVWTQTQLGIGDCVHVIWDPDQTNSTKFFGAGGGMQGAYDVGGDTIVIDEHNHWLIVHPYNLLSPSHISRATTCLRDAVIRKKMSGSVSAKAATLGNIRHDLYEKSMLINVKNIEQIYALIPRVIEKRAIDCYAAGISDQVAQTELRKFAALVLQSNSHVGKQVKRKNRDTLTLSSSLDVRIDEVVNSEEAIKSRMWGISAKPDLTVKIHATTRSKSKLVASGEKQKEYVHQYDGIVPFELKTGRANDSHRVQAFLYMLACVDRYQPLAGAAQSWSSRSDDTNVVKEKSGRHWYGSILLNLGNQDQKNSCNVTAQAEYIQMRRLEMQHIIHTRNALAVALQMPKDQRQQQQRRRHHRTDSTAPKTADHITASGTKPLPSMIKDVHECTRCFNRDVCMLQNATFDGMNATTSGGPHGELQSEILNRMSGDDVAGESADGINISSVEKDQCIEYYRKWTKLMNLEEMDTQHREKNVWTLQPELRESTGTCAANLRLTGVIERTSHDNLDPEKPFVFKFVRRCKMTRSPDHTRLQNTAPLIPSTPSTSRTVPKSHNPRQRLDALFQKGTRIMVSIQGRHMDICAGCVVLRVGVDHIFVASRTQLPPVSAQCADQTTSDIVWCIDKTYYKNAMSKSRTNVRFLLLGNTIPRSKIGQQQESKQEPKPESDSINARCHHLRQLVVHMAEPQFYPEFSLAQPQWWLTQPMELGTKQPHAATAAALEEMAASMNENQRKAVSHVLRAKDYSLMLGMPGTGKTTTIVFLIRVLLQRGCRVLLSAFTNSAVDNVLSKLKEQGFNDFVRIGTSNSKPDIEPHLLCNKLAQQTTSVAEQHRMPITTIKQIMGTVQLVAATCIGSRNQEVFNNASKRPLFDFCIVDEASQILEPTCIAPLMVAKRFVLVGDPKQLPAVVVSQEARDLGMSMSLFERLALQHPCAVSTLTDQYRMNEDITTLANELVYHGALRCGSVKVAQRKLVISPKILENVERLPRPILLGNSRGSTGEQVAHHWIKDVLNPEKCVLFVNTDGLGLGPLEFRGKRSTSQALAAPPRPPTDQHTSHNNQHQRSKKRKTAAVVNEVEVELVKLLCRSLIRCGVSQNDVGVISPYRSQLKLLSRSLQSLPQVEVNTVDQYQGRDKTCILFSLVRSNAEGEIGSLLGDWRRINVAFTRAKTKLVIVGSLCTLEKAKDEHIATFVRCIKQHNWILTLPENGHSMYPTL